MIAAVDARTLCPKSRWRETYAWLRWPSSRRSSGRRPSHERVTA